jgi:prophage antirepressor-like protein
MSAALVPFTFDGREVRTVMIDGKPWFVAADLCAILGLGNTTETLRGIRKDRLSFSEVIDSIGRKQRFKIINETGLYRLILRSNKPDAEQFQDWICDEVLPQIVRPASFRSMFRSWFPQLNRGPKRSTMSSTIKSSG